MEVPVWLLMYSQKMSETKCDVSFTLVPPANAIGFAGTALLHLVNLPPAYCYPSCRQFQYPKAVQSSLSLPELRLHV
jgi:hypothetical protein